MKCNALWDACKIGSFEGEEKKEEKGGRDLRLGTLEAVGGEMLAGCARRYPALG